MPSGAAGGIRTPSHLIRSQKLYPVELRLRGAGRIHRKDRMAILPCDRAGLGWMASGASIPFGAAAVRRYLLRVPALSLRQLTRRFPGASAPALAGLDLEIAEGEFLAVTGPSGSGKTTLLRLLAGLETPDEGSISFGPEANWHRRSPAERGVAMVGQQPALLPQIGRASCRERV